MPIYILIRNICAAKIPHFAKIKIPNTPPASKFTQHKTSITSIKDEIKYLYIWKKSNSTKKLLHLHPILANSCNNSWFYVRSPIEDIQPEDGYKKLKRVAESCKLIKYIIKILCWTILYYLINRETHKGMPCLKIVENNRISLLP
jgi:hypothetical protein